MFVSYFSNDKKEVVTKFLGIVNLKGKTSAEIMDVIKKFFAAKSIKLENLMFSVLEGTNAMSGKDTGLQRRIRFYSPFNIYINCRNHRLALCLPHLMKDSDIGELLSDFDALLLGLWKMFRYSPKKGTVLENVQMIYGKKQLKIIKAAVTRWLTHGRASQRILDRLPELLETMDHICQDTNECDVRGYRAMLMEDRIIFCTCLMTDILAIMNVLSLSLQKENASLIDIKYLVEMTIETLTKLSTANSPKDFGEILAPRKSYYGDYENFKSIVNDFKVKRANLRSYRKISIENFHNFVAIPLIKKLVTEVEEAFDTSDFPVIDAFQVLNPKNIPANVKEGYGMEEIDVIYSFYGSNKVNIFQGERNEAAAIIQCSEEVFISQATEYFKLISKKKAYEENEASKKVNILTGKIRDREKKKKCTAKCLKELQEELNLYLEKVKNPVTIEKAIECTRDIFPDISLILNLMSICPASGAVVERGFSLMNLIMNDLRSSMNIRTLDAIMRIHYHGKTLLDREADEIIDIWKRRGNRRIEL